MFIIKHRIIFFLFSGVCILGSFFAVFFWGLNFGIDFKGGSLLEVEYKNERLETSLIQNKLSSLSLEALIQDTGEKGIIIRTKDLSEEERVLLVQTLSFEGKSELVEKRFTSIGPVISKELRNKAFTSIILVSLLIILFITFTFRHVSEPVKSWKYGVIAILTLLHDVTIPTGLFAILGKVSGAEVDTLFITALLAILGISVSDTIVVFDRIRENLRLRGSKNFEETVGESLRQTIARSVNTSVTTLLAISALYFFGPESTQNFALVLGTGLIFGTYSSICIASPLLVEAERFQKKK
jgi:preprotein translocase subunit SecF